MPGLFGVAASRERIPDTEVVRAVSFLRHGSFYHTDPLYRDDSLAACRTHTGAVGEDACPVVHDDVMVWVEGEAYALPALADRYLPGATSFAAILGAALRDGRLAECLNHTDGYFSAALYDARARTLTLATDRYGVKPLYVYEGPDMFGWSSGVRAFLALSCFPAAIDREAARCYMDLGMLTGDMTWFANVRMLSAATMLTYDVHEGHITATTRYWSWNCIPKAPMPLDDAVVSLGELITEAVRGRVQAGGLIGLGLSGGLDSRAMLGALDDPAAFTAYTFGVKDCWDMRIARQAARTAGCPHVTYMLGDDTWLDGRVRDIWRTDGMQPFIHNHASHHLPDFRERFSISLNGYWGDIFGGFYFAFLGNRYIGVRITRDTARELYGPYADHDDAADPFYDIDSIDPYVFNNRGRRFAATGSICHSAVIEQRKPFLENRLIEFVYGLPDSYRLGGVLYNRALLTAWPALFDGIPWQASGFPPNPRPGFAARALHKLHHLPGRLALAPYPQDYSAYPRWMAAESFRRFATDTLTGPDALWPSVLDTSTVGAVVTPFLAGKAPDVERLARILTLELWLRCVDRRAPLTPDGEPLPPSGEMP